MLKNILCVTACSVLVSASSVMCYKNDHFDPGTIETTALNGTVCGGKLTVVDMKKDGYIVDDIKISTGTNGMNYMYIFKKRNSPTTIATGTVLTKEQIRATIKETTKEIKDEEEKPDAKNGKKIYESKCISCHKDGTISAYNAARPLATLSVEQIEVSIRDYGLDQKDNGMAILMKPYANMLSTKDVKDVAAYIQTLKK